jgi:flagellar motility protein MotE (MotC chaperone)
MTDKKLTKEEAQELYEDLSRAMGQMMAKRNAAMASAKVGAVRAAQQQSAAPVSAPSGSDTAGAKPNTYTRAAGKKSLSSGDTKLTPLATTFSGFSFRGQMGAVAFVVLFCVAKISISALEAVGVGEVKPVEAAVVTPVRTGPQWSKEEVKILTALDQRRSELEERSGRLEQREHEFSTRDRDLAARLTELKELSERLKLEREKGEKQRNVQLDQLANVYGSMNPPEAAHLLEQLDINIAHSLIQRMPEKRIGQILALMNAERALELTNRLSSKSAK